RVDRIGGSRRAVRAAAPHPFQLPHAGPQKAQRRLPRAARRTGKALLPQPPSRARALGKRRAFVGWGAMGTAYAWAPGSGLAQGFEGEKLWKRVTRGRRTMPKPSP